MTSPEYIDSTDFMERVHEVAIDRLGAEAFKIGMIDEEPNTEEAEGENS